MEALFHQSNQLQVSWFHVITMCMSHVLKSISPEQWICLCSHGDDKMSAFKEPSEWMTCVASTMLARVQHNSTPSTAKRLGVLHCNALCESESVYPGPGLFLTSLLYMHWLLCVGLLMASISA